MKPDLKYEKRHWEKGRKFICGVDEVGRGSWAGPMYVGAVIFDEKHKLIDGIKDSKKLTASRREELHEEIIKESLYYNIGIVEHYEIDEHGLTHATKIAIERAVQGLGCETDILLIDSLDIEGIDAEPIVKGDEVCYTIACASILAKVERDRYISNIPETKLYRLDKNKGYGTREHVELIKKHGISDIHRKSFKPVRTLNG